MSFERFVRHFFVVSLCATVIQTIIAVFYIFLKHRKSNNYWQIPFEKFFSCEISFLLTSIKECELLALRTKAGERFNAMRKVK